MGDKTEGKTQIALASLKRHAVGHVIVLAAVLAFGAMLMAGAGHDAQADDKVMSQKRHEAICRRTYEHGAGPMPRVTYEAMQRCFAGSGR